MASAPLPPNVGDYRLLTPIGRGGMGTVYAAQREIVTGVFRLFAVKLVHPELGAEAEVAGQLLAEAQLAAHVRHPNVVEVVEATQAAGRVYLVMEYVAGGTLSSLLRRAHRSGEPIPLPIVARILRDGLAGLGAAHAARGPGGELLGLIHRDFSPQNLIVGTDGITRLTDFGIAKAVRRRSGTATGVVKGKIGYMAPEQARGLPLDGRCDLWAAGVVLWETLTSRRLFDADSDAAILLELVSGADPAPPSSFRKDVPSPVDALVARALTRPKADRVASAEAFIAALDEAFAAVGVADEVTVASYVREAIGSDLDELASQIREATRTLPVAPTTVMPAAHDPHTETAVMTPIEGRPAVVPRSRRIIPVVAAAALLAGLATAYRPASAPAREARPWSFPQLPDPASKNDPSMLAIESNVAVAQLRMGDAAPVVLAAPARSFQVPRPPGVTTVELLTSDGRRERVPLAADAARITVTFAASPAKERPRILPRPTPVPPKPAAAPPADDDLLAPTP